MKKNVYNTHVTRAHQLPAHAYHPNPSLDLHRKGYIARP